MPSTDDWISNPLNTIEKLFATGNTTDNLIVAEHFCKLVKDQHWSLIPSLNDVPLHSLRTGSLVRFRCMVQDMLDPEFYLGVYEIRNLKSGQSRLQNGMYRDLISCTPHDEVDFDSPRNVTLDRQTLYCIPIPGENNWVKEAYRGLLSTLDSEAAQSSNAELRQKRGLDIACETMELNSSSGVVDSMETDSAPASENKRARAATPPTTTMNSIGTVGTVTPDLNFPLPNEKGPACLVKVYDTNADIKLNEVLEIVGVLSTDPAMATFTHSDGMEDVCIEAPLGNESATPSEEHIAKNPPPSLVPRLHAVVITKPTHNNPYLMPEFLLKHPTLSGTSCSAVREQIVAVFEQSLFFDRLAAEYLLCHLLSNVYARQNVVTLGKFALNLSGCPLGLSTRLYRLISLLVTKSHMLSMSLMNMNQLRFVPRKDYVTNRLKTGLLQLSARTHLIIDETALEAGQLDANGVSNMTALGNAVSWQKVDYDFDFHKQSFTTDIAFLVLSEGKSIIKCDSQVPLVAMEGTEHLEERYRGVETYLTPALVTQIRWFLDYTKQLSYSVTDDVQKVIEEDFVESRKDGVHNMTVDDFHMLLTLARLLSLSRNESCLTIETWRDVKAMELARKERLTTVMARG